MICALLSLLPILEPQADDHLLAWGVERIHVLAHGALGHRVLPPPFSAGDSGTSRSWRVRVRLATDLRVGEYRTRMDAVMRRQVRAAFARFGATVRGWTRGRLRIDADIAPLGACLRVADPGDAPFFLTPTRERNLGVSGEGVESVFLLFNPGRLPLAMIGGTFGGDDGPDGAGSSGIAWVSRREDEMTRVILHEWLHQLEWLARRGYGMPWLPGSHDRADLGFVDERQILCALLRDYLGDEFLARATMRGHEVVRRLPAGVVYPWERVRRDPWRLLPRLDAEAIAELSGYATIDLHVARGVVEMRFPGALAARAKCLDHRLELARESALVVPVRGDPGRFLIVVRGDLADTYGHLLRCDDRVRGWGALGVALPMRARRSIGEWEWGGTATPLLVFVTSLAVSPSSEIDLLSMRGGARLSYRVPKVSMEFRPRSGPAAVVRQNAEFVLRLRNNTSAPFSLSLDARLPRGVVMHGLSGGVRLQPGEAKSVPCRLRVAAGHPVGSMGVRLVARVAGRVAGRVRQRVHVAIGRDLLRLGFEGSALAVQSGGRRPVDPGDWRARRGDFGGACGMHFLQLDDGGGSRFGRHGLLAPSGLSFDTEQFPYLTFWLRAVECPGARAALNLAVDDQTVAIPLVGAFVRAWDERHELARADVTLDGRWHRVVYDLDAALDEVLGSGSHRVSAIDVGDTRALCSNRFVDEDRWRLDLDEFAVVRSPTRRPADRLRDLTERFRVDLPQDDVDSLATALQRIDPAALGREARVDYELLVHGLAWRRASLRRPGRKPLEPVGRAWFTAMLHHQHHLELSCDALLRTCRAEVRSRQVELSALAARIDPDRSWRQLAGTLEEWHGAARAIALPALMHRSNPSAFRGAFCSPAIAASRALLGEETVARDGMFPCLDRRFVRARMRLLRAARIVVDVSLHVRLMTEAKAARFLVQDAALKQVDAEREVARCLANPARSVSYLLDILFIEDLERRRGASFSSRALRDELLLSDAVPPAAIATGLGL